MWEKLDGLKTTIGMALLALAPHVGPEVVIPGVNIPLGVALYTLGGVLAGTGVTHKVIKATKQEEPKQ